MPTYHLLFRRGSRDGGCIDDRVRGSALSLRALSRPRSKRGRGVAAARHPGGDANAAARAAMPSTRRLRPPSPSPWSSRRAMASVRMPSRSSGTARRLHGLNASGRSPRAWGPQRFAGREAMPERGWESVTVPGAVAAWVDLSRRFGRLAFADLFAPAIAYARSGFHVSPIIAELWARGAEQLCDQPGFREAFMPGGRPPRPGELVALPDLAETLEDIAATGGESFYRGRLAKRIVAHARRFGAALDEDDLAAHESTWCDTISQRIGGLDVHRDPTERAGSGGAAGARNSRPARHRRPPAGERGGAAPADRGDEAGLCRPSCVCRRSRPYGVGDRARPAVVRLPGRPGEPHRPAARAGLRRRRTASWRHGLPGGGRCRRHDGLVHPVQLRRLRVRGGGARHRRIAAEPRGGVLADPGSSQRGRRRKTSVPHDHSRLCHAGRQRRRSPSV